MILVIVTRTDSGAVAESSSCPWIESAFRREVELMRIENESAHRPLLPKESKRKQTNLFRVFDSGSELSETEVDDRFGVVGYESEQCGIHPSIGIPEDLSY